MNVSAWSIRNPIPAVMLFVMLTLMGVMSFRWMKIQQFPDIDLPTVTVVASLPGAAPAQMETEVARKLENSVATLQGVKHIYTKVQDGSATVTVEFRLEKPTQEALDEVRDAVSRIRSDLPGDMRDPVISRMNLAGSPILTFTVASSRMDDEALSWFVDNTVTRRMLAVRGVGAVTRVGGVDREVRVELDPMRMLSLGITAADVSRQLRQVQGEASGGRADIGGSEQSVRTLASVKSAAELGAMEIPLASGSRRVRLDQVATVTDTVAEIRSAALLGGKHVVGFEIVRSRGAGEVDVANGVRAQLELLKALAGERRLERGSRAILLDGQPVGDLGPRERRERGMAFVPEERLGRGAVPEMSLAENGLLGGYRRPGLIEGGLIQSLSWTLKEEVQTNGTQVLSSDWASYPILTFSEVPPVEVVLIDRPGAPYLGTGEASQGPTGAALANAVFDAVGVRMRQLPLTPDRVLAALKTPPAAAAPRG